MNSYIMAVDGGTESIRVGIFDFEGCLVSQASHAYPTTFPRSGWAEQDPEDWWSALITATRDALKAGSVPPDHIAAVCTDATTCTLVPLDLQGRHLRPALLWMDVRAADQAKRIFQTHHRALCYSTSGLNAEWMLPKALWLKENEPGIYKRTVNFVEYQDWLAYRMTGRLVLNRCTSTHRWLYNTRGWENPGSRGAKHSPLRVPASCPWPTDLWEAVGLGDLEEKVPGEVLPATERVGSLTVEAAGDLGLSPSVPVFQGGADAFVALPGMGITEPGMLGLIAGSSNVLAGYTEREVHGPGILGAFPDVLLPGLWLMEGGQVSTGSILAWFRRHFALDLADETAYESLSAEAATIPPGSGGLIAIDYFQGNRTPYADSMARGAVWGLSLHTSRAHLFRAFMESIAYGTYHVLQTMGSLGGVATSMRACGGATKGDLYMRIMADVCGIPITLTEMSEASLLGGAVLAAVGLGIYENIPAASKHMVRILKTFEPHQEAHERYGFYFDLYRETYPRLRELMHRMGRYESAGA
ncbi:MAG TPA: FGGY-family carbohydrate kinase [Spirochaetia bacterium]|nr:FGGY-family carbohydrate kinase [Spirochaetia bacterium]